MRVLHIDRQRHWAGQQVRTYPLAPIMREQGDEVVLACTPGSGYEKRAAADGVPAFPIFMRGGLPIAAASIRIARLLRREKIDVIDAHGAIEHNIALVASSIARRGAVVRSKHNHTPLRNRASRLVFSKLTRRIIVPSAYVRGILVGQGVPEERVDTIPDSVYSARIAEASSGGRAEARARFGIPEDAFAIATTSRNTPRKGLPVALRAIAAVARERPGRPVVYVAAGCPPELARIAEQEGLPAGVLRLPGFLERVTDLFPALDLFLFPSLDDAQGLAFIEALAAGLPVVATRVGGVPEAVLDGETGLLVPPGDADALAAAIRRTMDDRGLAARLGAAGQALVRERHDIYKAVEATRKTYERAVGG